MKYLYRNLGGTAKRLLSSFRKIKESFIFLSGGNKNEK